MPDTKGSASSSSTDDPLAVQRGSYSRAITGPKLLFATFRLLSPPVQWLIINSHPLSRFGIAPPPSGGTKTIQDVAQLGLGPLTLPKYPLMMVVMPAVLGSKHIYWVTSLCNESMTWPFAFSGGVADLVYESITSLFFCAASSNPMFSPILLKVGFGIYVSAVVTELICELQRDSFKRNSKNKGRICDKGLWGWIRHPNYTANIVFGFAYGLAAGGLGYALCTGGMYASNLSMNAGPGHEEYMKRKYGEEWERYAQKVPYRLFPGIF